SVRRRETAGERSMRMITGRRAGDNGARIGQKVMIRSAGVNPPAPFAARLSGCEANPVGGSAVPEHRSPQSPSALAAEDPPGVGVGVRVGCTRANEGKVDLTPLGCVFGLHLRSPQG